MAVSPLSIPTRVHEGVNPPVDVNTVAAKVNELATELSLTPVSIPTRAANTLTRDVFRTDMNTLLAKIDQAAAAAGVPTTGLTAWSTGYALTGEATRMNTLVTKVNEIVNKLSPPSNDGFLIGLTAAQIRALPGSGAEFTRVKTQADRTDISISLDASGASEFAGVMFAAALMHVHYSQSNPSLSEQYRVKVAAQIARLRNWKVSAGAGGTGPVGYHDWYRSAPGWICAAEMVGEDDAAFRTLVGRLRYDNDYTTTNSTYSPMIKSVSEGTNNHAYVARAAWVASCLLLGDTAELNRSMPWLRRASGDASQHASVSWDSRTVSPAQSAFALSSGYQVSKTWSHLYPSGPVTGWVPLNPSTALAGFTVPKSKAGGFIDDLSRDNHPHTVDASGNAVVTASGLNYQQVCLHGLAQEKWLLAAAGYKDVWSWSDNALLRSRQWYINNGLTLPYPSKTGWADPLLNHIHGTTLPNVTIATYGMLGAEWLRLAAPTTWLK